MPRSIAGLLVGLCLAEILTMLGIAAFAALLPDFSVRWGLSSTEAGWIGSAYFVGYTLAVPVLVSLTDRIDPARIFIASLLVTAVAQSGLRHRGGRFLERGRITGFCRRWPCGHLHARRRGSC